jgi:hypothetical protein
VAREKAAGSVAKAAGTAKRMGVAKLATVDATCEQRHEHQSEHWSALALQGRYAMYIVNAGRSAVW